MKITRKQANDPRASSSLHAMSVDVEDYFHAHALENYFTRSTWPSLERRVQENTERILDQMDMLGIKATYFTLGSVALEYPQLVKTIVDRGHELASHGMNHYRASEQTKAQYFEDVSSSKKLLEDVSGQEVRGYRAASFSISPQNWWAFEVLQEAGYSYSSSISAGHNNGNSKTTGGQPFHPVDGPLIEYPISVIQLLGKAIPTGGGYFRLLPYFLFQKALRNRSNPNAPVIFYYHPWEIDYTQPKAKVPLKTQFRHRVNLSRMYNKTNRLMSDFRWAPLSEVFS